MGWDVRGGDPTRAHSLTPKGRCLFVGARECWDGDARIPPVHRAGPSPHLSHSGGPLPLCPFSVLPPIRAVPEAPEQPMSCQLQGLEGTESREGLGRTRRIKFLDEEGGPEEAQREGALPKLQEAKASCSQEPASSSGSASSLSSETPGKPSTLALRACDSVKLLRKRAKKISEAQEQPKEMAAATSCGETCLPEQSSHSRSRLLPPITEKTGSPTEKVAAETSHVDPSLPKEPSVVRSGLLPPIKEGAGSPAEEMARAASHGETSHESPAITSAFLPPIRKETGSPRSQSPNTKAPLRRKGTPYPR